MESVALATFVNDIALLVIGPNVDEFTEKCLNQGLED